MTERTCSVEGCERPHRCRGFCATHYRTKMRTGELDRVVVRRRADICQVEGCDRPVFARDWCGMHYTRWKRYGDLDRGRVYKVRDRPVCSVAVCQKPVLARGLCNGHYARMSRGDEINVPLVDKASGWTVPSRRSTRPCDAPGCDRLAKSLGFCVKHYQRLQRHGHVDDPVRRDGRVDKAGYRIVTVNGKRVREHRHVMEQHLGRPLAAHENVHHRDGQRSRNDIDNLELWVTPQPAGQRPEDLAEWVVEHYPELVEAAQANRRQLRLAL